jgi:phytoene dehydrogenase-like protein
MNFDAIVIGAGPNGLTAAAVLAKSSRKVLVLDEAQEIGGLSRTIEFAPGFRATLNEDAGWVPPTVVDALGLGAALQRATRSISVSVARQDGAGVFSLWTDAKSAATSIREYSPRDAERWPAFAERMHRFAGILGDLYQLTPPDVDTTSVREVTSLLLLGRKVRALGRDDMTELLRVMPMSVQDLLDDTFESETLKAAVASGALRDLRQGPRSGGTTFNMLHYAVGAPSGAVRGRAWWLEGPDTFARAAADVARRNGALIRTAARVERVLVRDYSVTGVALAGGEEINAPVVLSTADPVRTFVRFVDSAWLDPEFVHAVKNVKLRGATALVMYALDRLPADDSTLRAPVSLTPDTRSLEQAMDAGKYGEIAERPHVEIFSPSARWPALAPAGKHVLVARVQCAPYALKGGSWDAPRIHALAQTVDGEIARVFRGFGSTVVQREVLSPVELERHFGVSDGALSHGELTLDQILFMRPVPGWGHFETPVSGLFFGGSGAHPGPAILGGAGLLAAKRALAHKR